jgi:hypothetical protein
MFSHLELIVMGGYSKYLKNANLRQKPFHLYYSMLIHIAADYGLF